MILKMFVAALLCLVMTECCHAGGHQRLVRASGITPRQVGTAEGVGMSSRSYADAVQNACYWGKRVPVSIQYSYRNGRYYAVVRYR